MDAPEHIRKGSWLSIKSLKEAADLRIVLSQKDSSASSRSVSPESNVATEQKPNTYVNQSLSFSSIHSPYCETLGLLKSDEYEAMRKYLRRKEAKLKQIQDNSAAYCQNLQSELDKCNLEINKLTSEIDELKQRVSHRGETELDLSVLQAEYEKQISYIKIDHELLLLEKEEVWAQTIEEERSRTESIRVHYQEQINRMEQHYLKEIRRLNFPRLNFSEIEAKHLNQKVMKLETSLEEKNEMIEKQAYKIQQLKEKLNMM